MFILILSLYMKKMHANITHAGEHAGFTGPLWDASFKVGQDYKYEQINFESTVVIINETHAINIIMILFLCVD